MFRFLVLLLLFVSDIALADTPPPVPVVAVEAEELDAPNAVRTSDSVPVKRMKTHVFSGGKVQESAVLDVPVLAYAAGDPVVFELFSSQACDACPKADDMIGQLIDDPMVIALSCHVDYFDVISGSRALPFCSSRQSAYAHVSDVRAKYTPQVVVNGRRDAIGYNIRDVQSVLDQASQDNLKPISITPGSDGLFTMILAGLDEGLVQERGYDIWLMAYDKPVTIEIVDGENAGQQQTYYNLVSKVGKLGVWDGQERTMQFDAKLTEQAKGFAVVVQNAKSQHVIMAGKYEK